MGEPVIFPELNESTLDRATLMQLMNDLNHHAEVLDVLEKGTSKQRTDGRSVLIEEAFQKLSAGQISGVQIRYRWDDSEWRDTLLFQAPGMVRLVRIKIEPLCR
jgi:hypothetical protein